MRALEETILREFQNMVESTAGSLSNAGIGWGAPEIEVWIDDEANYTSEFRVMILKRGDVDDVWEFHIYRQGQAVVTESEAIDWLRERLAELSRA